MKSHGSRWVLGAELCRVVLNHGGSEACGYSPREGVFGNPRHSVSTLLRRVRQVVIQDKLSPRIKILLRSKGTSHFLEHLLIC